MARIRTIKPEFFKNDDLSTLSVSTRLLFIGLWTLADREGRIADRPKRIKAEIFPYDKVDVEKGLSELSNSGFVTRYQAQETAVLQINSFLRHQIPGRDEPQSELPGPDGNVNEYIKPPNDTVRNRIYQRDNYTCAYCGDDLTNKSRSRCLDHIIPYAKGGSNHESNLITSCKKCNTLKGCRTPEEAGMKHPTIDGVNGGLTDEKRTINGFVTGKGKEGKGDKERKGKESGEPPDPFEKKLILENPFSERFLESWIIWKDYKKKEFRFLFKSIESEQAALNDLVKKSNGNEETAVKIIHQSLANGWKGLFELKNELNESASSKTQSKSTAKATGPGLNTVFAKRYSERAT